jgi:hypothetical protein
MAQLVREKTFISYRNRSCGLILSMQPLQRKGVEMRLFKSVSALLVASAALWAADPFVGRWKLNVEKSDFGNTPKAKSGSTIYEGNGAGYMYAAETVFGEDEVARLQSPVEFNGTVHEGHLAERTVTFRSKKIDDNSYEVVFSDKQTGKVVQTFRYIVIGNELTLNWFNGDDQRPAITLMYDRQ